MEAIVLAGGLGTRLRSAVPDLPKPMAPVDGRPFLEYLLDNWAAEGVSRFVLSVGYNWTAIHDHFGSLYRGVPIGYAVEERSRGTGGGLIGALAELAGPDPFLAINGDTYFDVPLALLRRRHRETAAAVTLALAKLREPGRYGHVVLAVDGRLTGFLPPATEVGESLANGGVYVCRRDALARFETASGGTLSLEHEVFPALLAAGVRLAGAVWDGKFLDIGLPEDYRAAAALLTGGPSRSLRHAGRDGRPISREARQGHARHHRLGDRQEE